MAAATEGDEGLPHQEQPSVQDTQPLVEAQDEAAGASTQKTAPEATTAGKRKGAAKPSKRGSKKGKKDDGGNEEDTSLAGQAFKWTDNGIEGLVDVWGGKSRKLQGGNLTAKHWDEIAFAVSAATDCQVTAQQCMDKVDGLKKKYKSIKEKKGKTGSEGNVAKGWKWFEDLDRVLAARPKTAGVPGAIDGGWQKTRTAGVQIDSSDEAEGSENEGADPLTGEPLGEEEPQKQRPSEQTAGIEAAKKGQPAPRSKPVSTGKKSAGSTNVEEAKSPRATVSNMPGVSGQPTAGKKVGKHRLSDESPMRKLAGKLGEFVGVIAEGEKNRAEEARERLQAEERRHAESLAMERSRLDFQQQVALENMRHQHAMQQIAARQLERRKDM
ncbi:hypothetical protein KFL_007440040 [Klebsormidium nitens]|uniref:Myb/SANT-like DNA-binding domain-containing protein n=1 Tax=Klebsormidium nitens TaxID=105231 RepID=A0A1Y1IKB5_KLENI|nr:hypothetical protein KFL_007440040 [Klebsormidium nitens]|eukprot:GAQ91214.1 hypothetical protein KFL_007440040 [Klebsormidium nitens]